MKNLSESQKTEIYMEYLNGILTVEELAVKYNISDEEMFNILFEGKSGF